MNTKKSVRNMPLQIGFKSWMSIRKFFIVFADCILYMQNIYHKVIKDKNYSFLFVVKCFIIKCSTFNNL